MYKVGDKVEFLGLCYKITKIDGEQVWISILRKARNPRARKQFAKTTTAAIKPWVSA